ncbi:MAG: hypothetical protein WD737_10970 [Gemmatimonadota bacterium]
MEATDDRELLLRQRKFLHDIEQGIRQANQEIIHERIPELTRERFVEFALVVARLRASYLQASLEVSRGVPDLSEPAALCSALKPHRVAYEEARDAFEALQRAIERGYVDIGGVD